MVKRSKKPFVDSESPPFNPEKHHSKADERLFNEHKDILQRILDLMPKLKGRTPGKPKKLNPQDLRFCSQQAGKIFEAVTDYYVAKRGIHHIRNHVLIEKAQYDDMQRVYMDQGSKIGAEAVLKGFKEKSLAGRIRCAFSGRIR